MGRRTSYLHGRVDRQTVSQVTYQWVPRLADSPQALTGTWEDFILSLRAGLCAVRPDKRQLPAFSPVVLHPGATELKNDTVAATTMLVYDLDQLDPSGLAILCDRVTQLGAAAFLYESPSSTPEAPKVRLILPLDQPIDAARHKPARAFMAEALGLNVDPKTNDLRRIYFVGMLNNTPERQTILWPGAVLPAVALPGPEAPAMAGQSPGPITGDEYHAQPEHIHALAEALRPAWNAGNRQAWVLELLGWLRGKGWPESDLTSVIEELGDSATGENPLSDYLGMVKRAKPLTGLSAFVQQALGPAMAQADALAESHPNTTSSRIASAGGQRQAVILDGSMYAYLLCDGKGKPKANPENTRRVLEWHPAWVDNLRFNTLAQAVEVIDVGRLPEIFRGAAREPAWTAQHTTALRCWFHSTLDLDPGQITLPHVIGMVARLKSYSPVSDYLRSLTWDGIPRLDNWLLSYMGCRQDDPHYLRAVGRRILISAVARAHDPGCQADSMLILEGEQGTGKSSAVRILAGSWFDDTELDLTNLKDSGMQLRNVWLYEWGELAGLRRHEIARVKSWVSKRTDRFRAPYAPEVESQPRHCIFIGTCNPAGDYLTDTTGNRRFWPAYCGTIDLKALARDRDQLWAEANAAYHQGAEWHLTDALVALAREAQQEREAEDPLAARALEWVAANPGHTASEILSGLGYTYAEQTHSLATRLGCILSRQCLRDRVSRGFQRVRTYRLSDV